MKNKLGVLLLMLGCILQIHAEQVFDMASFGIVPNGKNLSAKMEKAIAKIKKEAKEDSIVIQFQKGRYDFYPEKAPLKHYYISNHAEYYGSEKPQDNPLRVGIALEDFQSLRFEGNGAQFVFHDCMLPISLVRSKNCTLSNLSIDFYKPSIPHIRIIKNEGDQGITFEVFSETDFRVTSDSIFETYGLGRWGIRPFYATVLDGESKRIAYNVGDVSFPNKSMCRVADRTIHAPRWNDERLKPGHVLLLRTWDRPAPGIFLFESSNTKLENITIHYTEGMGVLAQLCQNVSLDGIKVCFENKDSSRYITTLVDATHFSHCRGQIVSKNGFYENMGDDAINVHGIYLKVEKVVDQHTVVGRFMYEQTWGFDWGFPGDEIQFLSSETSDVLGKTNRIAGIRPMNNEEKVTGAYEFAITFEDSIDSKVAEGVPCCMENLTWTPEVYFTGNTICNNRARGSLFTTPRKVVVENNVYDHVSGSAILLSGDCSYWYESGACRDVLIRKNRFINVLSTLYMEANAVISIAPVITNLSNQQGYYHGGKPDAIRIIENEFDVFDTPILYVKSTDGILFKDNVIRTNSEYPPFHWNHSRFFLERVGKCNLK